MLRKYRWDIWDFIIWISLIILISYIIAKLFGLINTPEWINLIPMITLVFFAGAFYQKVIYSLKRIYYRTDYLKKNIDSIKITLTEHDKKSAFLAGKIK